MVLQTNAVVSERAAIDLADLRGRRVVVALSGGVDSAVAALMLVEAQAQVVAIALRLYDAKSCDAHAPRACCAPDDIEDARRVAEVLRIPFYVVDERERFAAAVVRPFVRGYLDGQTPNPCVVCNNHVKLSVLAARAHALGASHLVTGHYARLMRSTSNSVHLWRGVDKAKDQSYFLFGIPQNDLARLCFPLGHMTKSEVRARARDAQLSVSEKPDSQEVCFVGKKGAQDFVREHAGDLGAVHTRIVDERGAELGTHASPAFFTIGQRKGLGLGTHERLFVLGVDRGNQTVTVGSEERLLKRVLVTERASWPAEVPYGCFSARVKIRSRDLGAPATCEVRDDKKVIVRFCEPVRAAAPGQAAVFYDGERVVGGAWIARAVDDLE